MPSDAIRGAPTAYKSWSGFCVTPSHLSCHTGSYQLPTGKFGGITRDVRSVLDLGGSGDALLWGLAASRQEEEVRNLPVSVFLALFWPNVPCTSPKEV